MNAQSSYNSRRLIEVLSKPLAPLRFCIGSKLYERRYRNFHPSYSGDAVVSGIADRVAHLAAILGRGDIDKFLRRLTELTCRLLSEPLLGRALFVPELDELAEKANLVIGRTGRTTRGSRLLVHVATEVYPTGGHTRVIEDITAILPAYSHLLVLTGMQESHPNLASLRPRFDKLNVNVHLLRMSSPTQRVMELTSLIETLSPEAVLLFTHPEDAIANVSVSGRSAPRVLFLHHSDHQPSLGASRTDYVHVDLTPGCHRFCGSRPDLKASLLNLCVADMGTVKAVERDPIIGVTCGSPHKYAGSSEYSYAQLLAALFSGGVDQVFHIGDMPDTQKDEIRTSVAASGQDPSRILLLPNTPSLAEKLVEISPDFYLTSHPIGGGRATVEALSVGLPILYVCPVSTPTLLNCDMTFGASVPVLTLEEVPVAVHRLKTEKNRLGRCSRAVYEKHYSMKEFREGLLRGTGLDH